MDGRTMAGANGPVFTLPANYALGQSHRKDLDTVQRSESIGFVVVAEPQNLI